MPFAPDTQLGPYKIISLIGSGGMGEVYRARDTRLLRDVALKVLPASFTNDPDRLRRFEQEARAVAALNHPNIVSVYDVGAAGEIHYIVSELLEGDTLRQRITPTGIPVRRAIELASQLANGLAAAHDQGVVHRDLKPENIFVTRSGRLKILDFGLAKLRGLGGGRQDGVTATQTQAGQVMGTVGYMSPEQVKGDAVDHRSDIFSFGSILYEMLNGQRAFKRDTSAETMTAILNEDPPEFSRAPIAAIAPALERIVRHCLEKQPSQRFQSAQDIAFALESLSDTSSISATKVVPARKPWLRPVVAALLLLAAGVGLGGWLKPTATELHPKLHRITFRRGTIWNARFTPDGNLVYSAGWEGHPIELYTNQAGSTESRPLGMAETGLFAISKSGELAVASNFETIGFENIGKLGRAPLGGGAPRDVAENVEYADWSSDGENLAAVRRVAGQDQLEYPLGKILYQTPGWVSHPRISPDGTLIAFIDHPYERDDLGFIATVNLAGKKKTLTEQFISAQGLAWWPTGNEIWFTATTSGSSRELRAVTLAGKERLVYLGTGTLTLHDIFKDGRVLFSRDDLRAGIIGLAPGDSKERDLSWHDWTIARDLTNDGKLVAFDETGEAGGETGAMYIRKMDGSPAVRLADGKGPTFSPNGKWVVGIGQHGMVELPIGVGESRTITTGDVQAQIVYFFPDNRHILVRGSQPGHGLRLWVQDGPDGKPQPISPEGAIVRQRQCISPDGKHVAARDPEGGITIYPVNGDKPMVVPNTEPGDEPQQWTPDGKSLLVGHREVPARVYTINLATKERKLLRTFAPADSTGLFANATPTFSSDLKGYVYVYQRMLSDLYVVDGLK